MLKHEITFEDFDGNEVTETLYFNLSKTDILNWNFDEIGDGQSDGLLETLKAMIATRDEKKIWDFLSGIVLKTYGERSEDGKRFKKSKEISEDFASSAAYDAFMLNLATSDQMMINFIKSVLPKDIAQYSEAELTRLQEVTGGDVNKMADEILKSSEAPQAPTTPPPFTQPTTTE